MTRSFDLVFEIGDGKVVGAGGYSREGMEQRLASQGYFNYDDAGFFDGAAPGMWMTARDNCGNTVIVLCGWGEPTRLDGERRRRWPVTP